MTLDNSEDPKEALLQFVLNNLDKPRCAQLLLFIGVFDQNVQQIEQALDNGAHVNHSMTSAEKRILEIAGYSIPT